MGKIPISKREPSLFQKGGVFLPYILTASRGLWKKTRFDDPQTLKLMITGKVHETPCMILLVEDDPGHAELVQRGFDNYKAPHKIVHVAHGEAALDYLFRRGNYAEALESPRPHIVLLDLRLPRITGFDVLKAIKEDMDLRSISVIIMTTSAAREDVIKAYKLYANSFVVKPADFVQFTALIKELSSYWLNWNYNARPRKAAETHGLPPPTRKPSSWERGREPV